MVYPKESIFVYANKVNYVFHGMEDSIYFLSKREEIRFDLEQEELMDIRHARSIWQVDVDRFSSRSSHIQPGEK